MKTKSISLVLSMLIAGLAAPNAHGGGENTNPSECSQDASQPCDCAEKSGVNNGCIKISLDMGATTPWTGSRSASMRVFSQNDGPSVFTPDSLFVVVGATFKHLGNDVLADGKTAKTVVFTHENGEPVHFVFNEGESVAMPDKGRHIQMDERLMMVDAEGWAVTSDPVYYDYYEPDGTVRRFLATNQTGERGKLVYVKDFRGNITTPDDMGIDIVYGPNGVRQFLTPSRLADVVVCSNGYDVTVYPVKAVPAMDDATGLYVVPSVASASFVSVRRGSNDRIANVVFRSGSGEDKQYRYEFANGDWSLTRASGVHEVKERFFDEETQGRIVKNTYGANAERLESYTKNYGKFDWGYSMTNKVEGFGGVVAVTEWTYVLSGNGKGKIHTYTEPSGAKSTYSYDSEGRRTKAVKRAPGALVETIEHSFASVDPADIVPPVDTRPRMVVKSLDGVECERTYYVYSEGRDIVERASMPGAPYGDGASLRTVSEYYPTNAVGYLAGKVKSVRRESGKVDLYEYSLENGLWTETVTHLHEQAMAPVSGKTTREVSVVNARNEEIEKRTDAFIGGKWYTVSKVMKEYNLYGKVVSSTDLAGRVTLTGWDCCHKTSETLPDGSVYTYDYDLDGRRISSSRKIALDGTNSTWLTTCYRYDALGRQIATWQTNFEARVGTPVATTSYDALGRVSTRTDALGGLTIHEYGANGLVTTVTNPNRSTSIHARNALGDSLSVTGTGVTPEYSTYGIDPDGTRWAKTVIGAEDSPRFTKRYVDMLGREVRSERSGFQGAVLASVNSYDSLGRLVSTSADYEPITDYTYDVLGNRVATIKTVGSAASGELAADAQWRKSESVSAFEIASDDSIWFTQTNIVSCSDDSIAPLVTSSSRQLTGLTADLPSRSRSTDVRGNVSESLVQETAPMVTSSQIVPYAENRPLKISCYDVPVMEVSVSAVTNTYAYDALGRQIASTDGRGNTTRTEYNALGQRSASIDALGNRTTYTYDQFGNLASVVDPLGNATVYKYDIRGRKTYEGGATYPVRYTYDVFGNKTSMATYRNESQGSDSGDVTTWLYDVASGAMTNKVYADGKGPAYSYTPDGKLSRRIWARGIVTDYSYDNWGSLTNTVYSDDTPTVSLAYDVMGRQIEARDAAGITTFLYDSFGSLTNETVVGVSGTNTIERFWDEFGRTVGYALNGTRQSTLGYDAATGRLATMLAAGSDTPFTWSYLAGSDMKASLAYPNGLTASWQYDANNQLLQVRNATPTNIISQFDYSYDVAGRRINAAKSGTAFAQNDSIAYGYNEKSELTNAVATVDADYRYAYDFDDIGNRETSSERGTNRVYAANNLNQYSAIDDFVPQFDADGNQTLVKTSTGVWNVRFDAENRPVAWDSCNGSTNIVMGYDRLCRRISKNDTRFVYNEFMLVLDRKGNTIIWDPTEPGLTKPLAILCGADAFYYTHDGNKNVSEVLALGGEIKSHYDYRPFGTIDVARSYDNGEVFNFIKFSSEYSDDEMGTVYYNFRVLNPLDGRWIGRDSGEELLSCNLYWYVHNQPINHTDWLGLDDCREANSDFSLNKTFDGLGGAIGSFTISYHRTIWQRTCYIRCKDCSPGYTFERNIMDGGGAGASWNIPIPGLPAAVKVPVSISYSMSGGEYYYYNSCTKKEKTEKCHRIVVSGSIGATVGLGKYISYSIYVGLSYEWTDCGGESSKLSFGGTVEECIFGQCWSVDWPSWEPWSGR